MTCRDVMLTTLIASLFLFLPPTSRVSSIWPPSYKVNLTDEDTFEIFETLNNNDVQDVYDEEELVKRQDMVKLGVESRPEKYFRIHRAIDREKNKESRSEPMRKKKVFETFNPDSEYSMPWKGGFVDEKGDFIKDEDIIYFDESARNQDERKEKRDKKPETIEENYDYSKMKEEYKEEMKAALISNETLNYTNVKEDESLKDSAKKLVGIAPKNCTEEEKKGIGISAIECLFTELKKPKMKNHILEKLLRIVSIWFAVYLIIAIPCWCQYGWCCCCCRCKFCQPREEIEEVKRFFMNNPVGVYHDKDGTVIEYQPTFYEKYAQKKLEEELKRL